LASESRAAVARSAAVSTHHERFRYESGCEAVHCRGGKVILSFGGADAQYLESACSETGMYNLIKGVMTTQNIHNLDFDIEAASWITPLSTQPQQCSQAFAG